MKKIIRAKNLRRGDKVVVNETVINVAFAAAFIVSEDGRIFMAQPDDDLEFLGEDEGTRGYVRETLFDMANRYGLVANSRDISNVDDEGNVVGPTVEELDEVERMVEASEEIKDFDAFGDFLTDKNIIVGADGGEGFDNDSPGDDADSDDDSVLPTA